MISNEAWVDFVAGWCSGGAAVIACQPIDTILTRLQAGAPLLGQATAASSLTTLRPRISNFGVVSSLWRGSYAMVGAVPVQNALLMSGYGVGKRWSEEHAPDKVLFGVFVGGCFGGVLQSFLMSPVELIKVKQQVTGDSVVVATSNVARGIFSPSNKRGAWRGLGATLLRDGIPHGVWFASYEYAKNYLEEENRKVSSPSSKTLHDELTIPLLSGSFAATTAWIVGYPFDLIKTRIQASGSGSSILGTAKDLIRESGGRPILGLYRGFTLKLVRAIPASAIGFVVYEFMKKTITAKLQS